MSENYLNFNYFNSFMVILITSLIIFLAPFVVLTLFLSFLSDDNYKKIKSKMDDGKREFFLSFYIIIGLLSVLFSQIYLYQKTKNDNLNSIYDVKFIETSPISEIQYSKKNDFKGGLIYNLYRNKGVLYIIKDPKSDNYFVSDERDIVMKAARGEIRNNLDKITFSKETIKKTIENKVEEFPVVNESEFK